MRRLTRSFLMAAVCVLASAAIAQLEPSAPAYHPTPDDFSKLGESIVQLLQTHDAARFARQVAPSVADYRSVVSSNRLADDADPSKAMQMTQGFQQHKVETSAKAALERLKTLGIESARGEWRALPILPDHFGQRHWPNLQAEGESIPAAEEVEFVLTNTAAPPSTNGDFTLALLGMLKFAGGWRCHEGLQWTFFPGMDPATARNSALLKKVSQHLGFNDKSDPALRKLGEGLAHFIRTRDSTVFAREALFTSDLKYESEKKAGPPPNWREFDQETSKQIREELEKASAVTQQMAAAGIDLKDAQVQVLEASIDQSQAIENATSMDRAMGFRFRVRLEVKTERKTPAGRSLAGEYVLAANRIDRFEDEWRVRSNLHWYHLPEGLLDAKTVAGMDAENYVSEHRTLPPGQPAPEIEFRPLSEEQSVKLSSLRGKVVVLDFWATWCGPCQEPMAELQKLRAAHPAWGDQVAIVPVSIDNTISAVRAHVEKRGWTNTFNVWAGEGGWHAAAPETFRVTSVPTTYILDAAGRIVRAGHPLSMDIPGEVDALLKGSRK